MKDIKYEIQGQDVMFFEWLERILPSKCFMPFFELSPEDNGT